MCQDEWLIDFIGRAEPVAVLKPCALIAGKPLIVFAAINVVFRDWTREAREQQVHAILPGDCANVIQPNVRTGPGPDDQEIGAFQ